MSHVRLLPRSGAHGKACLLVTDGGGDGTVSRLADRIEDVQLGLAERLLGRAREVVATPGLSGDELSTLAVQLVDALHDALLIAECRSARLGKAGQPELRLGGEYAVQGVHAAQGPLSGGVEAHAFSLLTLPGRDRASAGAARRHVRGTTRSWGLPSSVTDDLETITGELVANALEHSGSHTITVACAFSSRSVTISVTDEGGRGRTPVAPVEPPRPDQEHGRGLQIIGTLADRWGTRQSSGGLTVWAEVDVESPE